MTLTATPAVLETVSIIVEQDTRQLLDQVSFTQMLSAVMAPVAIAGARQIEVILVGGILPVGVTLPHCVRHVPNESSGYYQSKNVGARLATGDLLVFWDSDCRPDSHYLSSALSAMDADPSLIGVTGVTSYDGSSWLSRLNTILSFGYLREPALTPVWAAALAHNVVLRRSRLPDRHAPFGSYLARSGGDIHLTKAAAAAGRPLLLIPELRVLHEDPSFSIRALLERHLREHFNPVIHIKKPSRLSIAKAVVSRVFRSFKSRREKIRKYGRLPPQPLGLTALVPVVLLGYLILDLFAALAIVGCRPLLDRWLHYQFGMSFSSWNQPSPS